ncbi:MAG TPA: TAXI family TRAP transporter solute-binding subunit, partial [Limnochordales bacterium]
AVPARASMPRLVSIGTHPTTSLYGTYGVGLSGFLTRQLGIEVRHLPTNGPVVWVPMMERGEVDLGIANAYDVQTAYLGTQDFEPLSRGRGFALRLVANTAPNIIGVLVPGDSGIRTGQDLRGRRYVLTVTGSGGITMQARGFLANFGLSPSDVVAVSVPSIGAALQAVMEGRADATSISIDVPAIRELQARRGALFLAAQTSPEAVEAFRQFFPPAYPLEVNPDPPLPGVRPGTPLIAYDTYLVARADLADEVVYRVLQALWEKGSELVAVHPRFRDWRREEFLTARALVPYHPGAVRFFRERGLWTSQFDELQARLLRQRQG